MISSKQNRLLRLLIGVAAMLTIVMIYKILMTDSRSIPKIETSKVDSSRIHMSTKNKTGVIKLAELTLKAHTPVVDAVKTHTAAVDAAERAGVKLAAFRPRSSVVSGKYKNVCYLTVKSAGECEEICQLDTMCFYSFYYSSSKQSNCFTQLFFNSTQPDCTPYNSADAVFQVKTNTRDINPYTNSTIIDTPMCHKPNYHPVNIALAAIADRRSITKKYHCRKTMHRRFKISEDGIQLTKSPPSGENCKFRYIYRTYAYAATDEFANLTGWVALTTETTALTDEFIEIVCWRSGRETYRDYSSYVPAKLAAKNAQKASQKPVKAKTRRFDEKMSVLLYGIDSTSLNQGYRQLPRTLGYIQQNMNMITFKGYNRVQDNTFMNLYAVLTGKPILEGVGISMNRFFDDDPLLFKWFRNDGFVTGYYEDYKAGALFNWLKKGFHYKPSDHYCKPFVTVMERKVAQQWYLDFCYLDKGMHVWLGDWTRSFLKQYDKLKYPYFLWSWTTMISHEAPNSLGQSDVYYHQLFKDLHQSNTLNNTITLLYSDHGYRYGGLRSTTIGQHEENSPMMHWIIPEWFEKKYPKEMKIFRTNAGNRITTPFDIHRTMLDFANDGLKSAKDGGMVDFGRSLFEPIDERRTCADAGVSDHYCACRNSAAHPLDHALTKQAAQAVVDRVNVITSVSRKVCLVYTVRYIKAAYKHKRHDIDNNIEELAVTVGVRPGDGVFSATVHIYPGTSKAPEVKGISRVSLYGGSANCVRDFRMRLYCSCKGLTKMN